MAKITLTFEDSTDGVIYTAYGVPIPSAEEGRTDAQKLMLVIKKFLEEASDCKKANNITTNTVGSEQG